MSVTVFSGPMYAGKTTAMLAAVRQYDSFTVVKPSVDDRYSDSDVVSHNGESETAVVIDSAEDINTALTDGVEAVGVDEAQFFDSSLSQAVTDVDSDVYVSGLDTDFRGEPFGAVPGVEDVADTVVKLTAYCGVCGDDAGYTQRLIDGEPARYDAPVVDVGGSERYEARCRDHHVVY